MKVSIKKTYQPKLFFLVCLGFLLTSCFINGESSLLEKDGDNSFKVPADTLISIKNTAYLGQGYTIVISADGKTVLTPTEYMGHGQPVVPQGVPIKSQISQEQLVEIIREFEKADFFSLKDAYWMGEGVCKDNMTDGSKEIISITIKGKQKNVHWENCYSSSKMMPAQLPNILDKIHETINLDQIF